MRMSTLLALGASLFLGPRSARAQGLEKAFAAGEELALESRRRRPPAPPPAAARPPAPPLFGAPAAGVAYAQGDRFLYPGDAVGRALALFPESSSVLTYQSLGTGPAILRSVWDRGAIPQIGLETDKTLDQISAELDAPPAAGPGYDPDAGAECRSQNAKAQLARWAISLAAAGRPVYLRPLSEMNDGKGAWERFSIDPDTKKPRYDAATYPKLYAKVWSQMRAIFRAYRADNVKFLFVSEGGDVNRAVVEQILREIPAGQIDAVGVNPYARAAARGADPVPLERLVESWRTSFAATPHGGLPFVIGECGVSGNPLAYGDGDFRNPALLAPGTPEFAAWDEKRARWIRDGFGYARRAGISLVVYFDHESSEWAVTDPATHACVSQACLALREQIAGFARPAPP
jgi:hypothetical protein